MKKREKIMGIKEQSGTGMMRESMWYFNEETANNFFPGQEFADSRRGLSSEEKTIRGKYEPGIPKSMGKNRLKRDISFVVDWQLSDKL